MSDKYKPWVVTDNNLSKAWARAFLKSMSPKKELIPLVVIVTELNNGVGWEDMEIRRLLDTSLQKMGKQSCNTVANTIFPESLWNPNGDRDQLYNRYKKLFPCLQKIEKKNNLGLYFERLIAYDPSESDNPDSNKSNQLEHIIRAYTSRQGVRRSVLQAAIFDPRRDHSRRPYLKFPCLQHVTFTPYGDGRGMAVNGFYAMQYLFERAYGNYLGLCRLGRFVAHELGLELVQMNCMVGIGKLEVYNDCVKGLAERIKEILAELEQK